MQIGKKKQIFYMLALLSADIAIMGDKVIIPIISDLYSAFPSYTGWVNYIVSGPLFITFIFSLITSKLFPYVSKKKILIFSGVLFSISSIWGCAFENVVYLSVMRTIYGASIGLINVTAVALIAELSENDDDRTQMTSTFNSGLAIIGTIASLCAGILGAEKWQGVFRYFYISIIMVILFIVFLPDIPPNKRPIQTNTEKKTVKHYTCQFWVCMVTVTTIALCFNIIAMFVSSYIHESGLGGTMESSIASALVTVGGMVISFLFTSFYKKFKKYTIMLSIILLALAIMVLHLASNIWLTYISMLAVGCAYMCALNFSYSEGANCAPDRIDDAIGMATALFAVAGFSSTYIVTALKSIMETEDIRIVILAPLVLLVVLGITYPIIQCKQSK